MVFDDLEGLLRRVRESRPGLKTEISRMPGGMATMVHGPVTIPPGALACPGRGERAWPSSAVPPGP